MASTETQSSDKLGPLTIKGWIAVAIGLATIVFIVQNNEEADIQFLFITSQQPLYVALVLAFLGGMVTGALWMRRHTNQKES